MTRISQTYDELSIGDTASITRVVTPDDLYVFAHVSGNLNPLHLPGSRSGETQSGQNPAPSMWLGSLFSAILGNLLPGPGTLYDSQVLRFRGRAHVGDTVTVTVRVEEKRPPDIVVLSTRVLRGDEILVDGTAEVQPPEKHAVFTEGFLPELTVQRHRHVGRLMAACEALPPLVTAVVVPEEENALRGALAGARNKLIRPVLIGDAAKIAAVARTCGLDLRGIAIEDVASHDAAAARAVEMVQQGTAGAVMKGHLHTDELLRHVVKSQGGLRTARRISHVFVMDAPALPELVLVTDAAINIAPSLEDKVDIVQNAIDLAQALGIALPRVGIISAVETVNPKMQSTIDAASLSKMAERGQIRGGIVDGPLAMDNAISLSAARTKGLTSLVAGRADVLVVPNLEAGNILAKDLTYAAQAEGAGIVLGAKVPVLLTSRADDEGSRLFSCAVAVLYAHWLTTGESAVTHEDAVKEAAQ
nr:bifunctional enoyl-CoA hydratase/phosphate acetyltransferase [uncultured Rhodopila sp.]